jgi:hypothetical protein
MHSKFITAHTLFVSSELSYNHAYSTFFPLLKENKFYFKYKTSLLVFSWQGKNLQFFLKFKKNKINSFMLKII